MKRREGGGKEERREGARKGASPHDRTPGCFTMTFLRKSFLFEEISGVNSAMFDRRINP